MPPKLTPEQQANMSMEELGRHGDQVAMAAAQECGADKEAFLKKHPKLDFRNRK